MRGFKQNNVSCRGARFAFSLFYYCFRQQAFVTRDAARKGAFSIRRNDHSQTHKQWHFVGEVKK